MTPNDMSRYRQAFDRACTSLGWQRRQLQCYHERDYDCTWVEEVWVTANGTRLFSESDLEPGMLEEIIRISELVEMHANANPHRDDHSSGNPQARGTAQHTHIPNT